MRWSWLRPDDELRKAAMDPAYQPIVNEMRERVGYWMSNFSDNTTDLAGWAHNYSCPTCAGQLDFDVKKPHIYHCSACDKDIDENIDLAEAWTYMRRIEISKAVYDAGILYRMDRDEAYTRFIGRVVDFYADNYPDYREYGIHAGRGKIMGQCLDEAVFGVNLLKGLILIDIDPQCDESKRWHHRLFLPMSRLTMGQSWGIHNIPLWHTVFAVGAGLVFGDTALARQAFTTELGGGNQIMKGFTADGIWYENSSSYHYYSLEAAANMCRFIRWAGGGALDTALGRDAGGDWWRMPGTGNNANIFQRVLDGYVAFLKLLFRDGTMPAFNDGWRNVGLDGLRGKLEAYLGAARLFDGMDGLDGVDRLAAAIRDIDESGTLGGLLYGRSGSGDAPQAFGSVNMPSNGLAVLRSSGMEVFVKYGNITRSHAHPDALSIAIPGFADDLGTCGYGSPFYRGWYTRTLSHNTFVVDGKSQAGVIMGRSHFDEDNNQLTIAVDNAYEGVAAKRILHVNGNILTDCLELKGERPHTYDWVFHGAGAFTCEGSTEPASLAETDDGYDYLSNVRAYTGDASRFMAKYELDGRTLALTFDALPTNAMIYIAESPDNPADVSRSTILVRMSGMECAVQARYRID